MVSVTHSFAQTSQRLASRSLRTLRHCQYCHKQEPSQETGRLFAFYACCQTSRNLLYYTSDGPGDRLEELSHKAASWASGGRLVLCVVILTPGAWRRLCSPLKSCRPSPRTWPSFLPWLHPACQSHPGSPCGNACWPALRMGSVQGRLPGVPGGVLGDKGVQIMHQD